MPTNPARGAMFCSGGASSFRFIHQRDPNFGKRYEFVGAFSDVPGSSGIAYARDLGIPTHVLDFRAWCRESGVARTDLEGRKPFFAQVLRVIAEWEPSFIMLSGFMLILTEPLLSAFEGCIVNVHPAFLSLLDAAGRRKYVGTNTVARAMAALDPTGSTVHIVTREPDMGPIVAESAALPYWQGDDPGRHQEQMKLFCDGPAFQQAFDKLIGSGWPVAPWRPR
jgi:phosphoribosylglycinamide formyltransferase-1